MEAQFAALEKRVEEHDRSTNQKFDELMKMMQHLKESMLVTEVGSPRHNDRFSQPRPLGYIPKLEFSKFDGTNPRSWIKKCCKYFTLCKIPDEQKVDLASLHMIYKAENWVSSYLTTRFIVDWNDFVIDVNVRFKDESGVNVVEEYNKLHQTESIEAYVD